jgi:hypothetical protein
MAVLFIGAVIWANKEGKRWAEECAAKGGTIAERYGKRLIAFRGLRQSRLSWRPHLCRLDRSFLRAIEAKVYVALSATHHLILANALTARG